MPSVRTNSSNSKVADHPHLIGSTRFYRRWESWRLFSGFLIALIPFFGPPFVTFLDLYFASANSGDHYGTGSILTLLLVLIDIAVPILTGFKVHTTSPRATVDPDAILPSFTALYIAYGITTALSWFWLGWAFYCSGNRYRASQSRRAVFKVKADEKEPAKEDEEIGLNVLSYGGSGEAEDGGADKVQYYDEEEIVGHRDARGSRKGGGLGMWR